MVCIGVKQSLRGEMQTKRHHDHCDRLLEGDWVGHWLGIIITIASQLTICLETSAQLSGAPTRLPRQLHRCSRAQDGCMRGLCRGRPRRELCRTDHLGTIWSHLETILALSGAILRPSWAILGPSWGHLGPPWGHLGPSWGHVGAIFAYLGASWGQDPVQEQKY